MQIELSLSLRPDVIPDLSLFYLYNNTTSINRPTACWTNHFNFAIRGPTSSALIMGNLSTLFYFYINQTKLYSEITYTCTKQFICACPKSELAFVLRQNYKNESKDTISFHWILFRKFIQAKQDKTAVLSGICHEIETNDNVTGNRKGSRILPPTLKWLFSFWFRILYNSRSIQTNLNN